MTVSAGALNFGRRASRASASRGLALGLPLGFNFGFAFGAVAAGLRAFGLAR
jgi:hypothetical protein